MSPPSKTRGKRTPARKGRRSAFRDDQENLQSIEARYRRGRVESANAIQWANYYSAINRWKFKGSEGREPELPFAAKPPSQKQIGYLRFLLGSCGNATIVRYVEFANALTSGMGYHPEFQPTGKIFLSRIYWIHAINLIEKERNVHGSALELHCETECKTVSEFMGYDIFESLSLDQTR